MTARSDAVRRVRGFGRGAAGGLGALVLSAALLSAPSLPALADPPLSAEEAKAQVAVLEMEAAAIDQEYVGVKERIAKGRKALSLKQTDVTAQTTKVARMRVQVGQVALAQFQNRTLDTTAQLFLTSDTDGFLNQISTVQKVSENQNTVLQDFQAEQAELAALERSAASDLAALESQEKSLVELRASSDAKLVEAKAVLARLTEEERERIAAEERRLSELARRAGEAAATTGSAGVPGGAGSGAGSTASGRGAVALAFARDQLGKPYRYAAAGPDAYDCSGLTSAAWRRAGVSLPRTSQAQGRVGRRIGRDDLQPGDLVFFYADLSHVGLYVGQGMIIHAPNPSKSVEYSQITYMPFQYGIRPA